MTNHTLVIAECGSSWDCDIEKAFRLIDAAKACGADIAKFQWTSNAKAMAERRLGANAARSIQMYRKYLEYPFEILTRLKAHCDSVGIEFLVTTFLPCDIATIAPLVKRFKVSAFECEWDQFVDHHEPYGRETIISNNPKQCARAIKGAKYLHCISKYPTPIDELDLSWIRRDGDDGLSDHTTSTLTGALAVAAGATIVEKHIRLHDTDDRCPDYPHSLIADRRGRHSPMFEQYVQNIRLAERAL